jgi:GNAT superfamily N-acetyltransferase
VSHSANHVILRAPTSADIGAAARCQLLCWQEAYAGLIDANRLAAITGDLDRAISMWEGVLASDRTVILAADGDFIVGFAIAGPASELGLDITLRLNAINVRRAYWGTGVGQRLLDTSIGYRAAFGVFRENYRARAFYVRNGFVPDGAEQVEEFFGPVEIRMVRQAISRSSSSASDSSISRKAANDR